MGFCEHRFWHSDFMKKECCEHGFWHSGCKKKARYEHSYWHSGFMNKDCCDHGNWHSGCMKTNNLTSWTVVTFSQTSLSRVLQLCLFISFVRNVIIPSDVFILNVWSWSLIYISRISETTSWSHQSLKSMDTIKFIFHVRLILTGKDFCVLCVNLHTKFSSQKHFFHKFLQVLARWNRSEWGVNCLSRWGKGGWNYEGWKTNKHLN